MAPPTPVQAQAPANIRVLVRVRPLNKKELSERGSTGRANVLNVDENSNGRIDFDGEDKENGATISINHASDANRRVTSTDFRGGYASDEPSNASGGNTKQYTFDAVHGERSTQGEVYESVKGIVDAVVAGYNGTIVAYGQTGSGKTHTVFGDTDKGDRTQAGLLHRFLQDIFQKITLSQAEAATSGTEDSKSSTTFKGSFFEIFNERIYDLLALNTLDKALAVREDSNGVYVEKLKEMEVKSVADAQSLLARGLANRHVASTNMNRTSSRSHAIFVLNMKTEHTTPEGLKKVRNSKFTLVDLAGSERQKSTDAIGNRLKEASMINKSLLCLGHVINALVDKEHGKARHIPFRNSKLTFLLKDTWGGNSKTCLVATVSPSGLSQSETISTLTFAQRAKLIKNTAILNEDTCGTVEALKAEVAKLRSKLHESSSAVVEKIVESEAPSSNEDLVFSLKRRSERAEGRIAELEKQMSDETEIVNTLKRKIQEETMVRKLKERRLDYMQRKQNASSNGTDHQVEILRVEIKALQKRLDSPSEDAIGWRVAYEEAREALEKKMEEDDGDYAELEEKKSLLEETVDRLCVEKFELERKIIELTESSSETREEIESIMTEVDALEKEMIRCQEELNAKNNQCREYKSRANDAETNLEKVEATFETISKEKEQLENHVLELKASISDNSQNVTVLTNALEKKNTKLLDMESLIMEKENKLQCTIDELRKDLQESKNEVSQKNDNIRDLENRLCGESEKNQNLKAQIKAAISEVECQKSQIVVLEERINMLGQEKNTALESMEEKRVGAGIELTKKIENLEMKVTGLCKEKKSIEAEHSLMKESLTSSSENLDRKQTIIQKLQTELSEKSTANETERISKDAILRDLDEKFGKAQKRIEVLSAKIASVEAERQTNAKQIEEERDLMGGILRHEINVLQRSLKQSDEQNSVLDSKLKCLDNKEAELKSMVVSLMDTVKDTEGNLFNAKSDYASLMKTILEANDREKRLRMKISELENERDELLEEIYEMNEEMREIVEENSDIDRRIQSQDLQIESLRSNVARVEEAKLQSDNLLQEKIKSVLEDCNVMSTMKEALELQLKEKEAELARSINESAVQMKSLKCDVDHLRQSLKTREAQIASERITACADKEKMQQLKIMKESLDVELCRNRKEMDEIQNTSRKREQEIVSLQESAKKILCDYNAALLKLSTIEEGRDNIEKTHSRTMCTKDNECEAMSKQIESITASVNELKDKNNNLQDRLTLLQREKGNLEFELDTIQEDQNALSDQVRILSDKNHELLFENERLQRVIDDMKNGENQSLKSEAISSSGSTWNSDSRLSYDTLSTNLDNMLEKISEKREDNMKEPSEECNLDDSFDESMFLPNVEDAIKNPIEETLEGKSVDNEADKENIGNKLFKDNKVHSINKPNVLVSSTPSKTNDYGKRRIPLSDRKNMTPLSTQSKRLHSSSQKVLTSSKKSRTNYMFIDNNRLFD